MSSPHAVPEDNYMVSHSFPNLKILSDCATRKALASLLSNEEELSCSSESLRNTMEIYSQLERQLGLK
jgi:hypothetical protein